MSEANQLAERKESAVLTLRFFFYHQLGCFAFVTQNDSPDRFVRFAKRASPRNGRINRTYAKNYRHQQCKI